MKIDRLDHLVLTVKDIETTIEFYTTLLGMESVSFGEGRRALRFGQQKLNLHRADAPFKPHAREPLPGTADLCLIAATPLRDVIDELSRAGVPIEEGPVARTGAVGEIVSVYFRDPDGNLIEVSNYA
jgi:catechol 2,3-dioxygenase-like lactoylglutathione lyase family enzyme